MQKFKKIITKFIVILSLGCLLTVGIFFCANRPITTKAEPITGAVVITGAILAFLAACGVEITSSNMDTTTLQECVEDMTSDYTYDNKTGATAWYADAGTVANIISGGNAGDKTVIIGSAFSQWLSGLPAHLEQKYGLNTSSSTAFQSQSGVLLADGSIMPFSTTYGYNNYSKDGIVFHAPLTVGDSVYYDFGNGNGFGIYVQEVNLDRRSSFVLLVNKNGSPTVSTYGNMGSASYAQRFCIFNVRGYNNPSQTDLYCYFGIESSSNVTEISSQIFNYTSNFPDLTISSMSLDGALLDGYQDLQDAMDEALGRIETNVDGVIGINVGAMEGTITQEDVWERILVDTLDNTFSGELTGDYTDEDEAEEELQQEAMPTVSEMNGNIVVIDGLEDFFPFCIPFDLYEILSVLSVPPETPDFTYTISFGGLFDDFDIDIDLSDFDGVARLFRIMMLIGFVVFLILKTRDLIRG